MVLKLLEILLKGTNNNDKIPDEIIDSFLRKMELFIKLYREEISIIESIKIIR